MLTNTIDHLNIQYTYIVVTFIRNVFYALPYFIYMIVIRQTMPKF